jgi:dTDP-4-amino-4,6-dideoxygalactose transaminase
MAITCNVPIPAFLGWLAELGSSVIIEFVTKEDPMVQQLLLNKDDTYGDYNRAAFEQHLTRLFRVEKSVALTGGTRFLYFAVL